MQSNRDWLSALPLCRLILLQAENLRLSYLSGIVAVCFLAPQYAHSQEAATLAEIPPLAVTHALEEPFPPSMAINGLVPNPVAEAEARPTNALVDILSQPGGGTAGASESGKGNWFKRPGESEIIIEGLVSYGNYKIFASGYDEKLFTGGVEYDRHTWGYFLKAQVDYVAEFLPFVLLDKPLNTDIWGTPIYPVDASKAIREHVPGVGFSPIGFRMQWRSKKAIRPYLEAKGGVLVFTKKVPSSEASYLNFSMQSATGVQLKMSDRWGLRLGLFSDFHFSDDFIVPVNPGLDVMNANLGLSYHF
ncbi:MAG: acyloxyacyl hydrolase [Terracidiphilus sp.]